MTPTSSRIASVFLGLAASLALCAPPAFAQSLDKEPDRPAQALQNEGQAQQAAAQAASHAVTEDAGKITYEQVLTNPDDTDLNYRYAKQQVQNGDLKGAAATLERVLLVNPALPKVRLFYAIVLFRLDILPESFRELTAVRDMAGVPASVKSEVQQYLDMIQRRMRKTNLSTRYSIGFQYDTNRNAAPNNGYRLFADQPVKLTSGFKTDDSSLVNMARVGLVQDLGTQEGHNLFADFDWYRADENKLHNLDFSAYSWQVGGTYKWQKGSVAPAAVFNYATLNQQTYLRTRGVSIDLVRRLNNRWNLTAEVASAFQEFIPNTAAPTADERTGQQTDISVGLDYVVNPKNRVSFSFTHTDKDARAAFQGFKRETLRLTHAWVLGEGIFLLSNISYNDDMYKHPELAVYHDNRIDSVVRLGPTLGVPLSLAHPVLKDLLLTVGYEFLSSNSTVLSYTYYDHKFNSMLTYRWDL